MTSKEAETHIVDTINGDMNKEYFINELLPEILKDLERLEQLENENQELKHKYESHDFLYQNEASKNGALAGEIFEKDLKIQKLKNVIKFLGELLGLEPDLENHNLITDEGTIAFVNAAEETMSILELLKEVLENE